MAKKNQVFIDVVVDDKGTTKRVAVNAKKLGIELERSGAGADRASRGTDKLSKNTKELDRNMKGASKQSANSTKNFSKMSQGMGGLVGAYATLAAQVFAVSAAFQFLSEASQLKNLIAGQEALGSVTGTAYKTITNSIKLGKTPNAYLLTGIRGVGKTTTARLIAKALNCTKNLSDGEICSDENCHCKDIVNSNHMDVLEMDAASKTGIDDVRELIENSKYSPTSAKFKIFIIDEVHMLSKQAFNGLLKTLEEPPPSLKFILATTEVRKIPVLSLIHI